MEVITCSNCGAEYQGNYCNQCGQKRQQRLSTEYVASEVYSGFFDFESPFLKTLITLTVNPGKVYREYIDGARKRYFSPVRYSLWLMTLMVGAAAFFDVSLVKIPLEEGMPEEMVNALQKAQSIFNAFMIPFVFLSAAWVAGVARLVFRSGPYTFTELYLPILLNMSQVSLLMTFAMPFGFDWAGMAGGVIALVGMVYMTWGLAETYVPRSWKSYLKAFCVAVFGQLSLYVLFMTIGYFVGGLIAGYQGFK